MRLQSSVSRIPIEISVQGKGSVKGEVFRHLSPITLNALVGSLPIEGRAAKYEQSFVYVTSGVVVGVEKGRRTLKRGEIAFLALNGAVCFFLRDSDVVSPMNPLGRILSGIEVLENISPGDVIVISRS